MRQLISFHSGQTRWHLIGVLGHFGAKEEADIICKQLVRSTNTDLGVDYNEKIYLQKASARLGGKNAVYTLVDVLFNGDDDECTNAMNTLLELASQSTEVSTIEPNAIDVTEFVYVIASMSKWGIIERTAALRHIPTLKKRIERYIKLLAAKLPNAQFPKNTHFYVDNDWDGLIRFHSEVQRMNRKDAEEESD